MKTLQWNIILALLWAALVGEASFASITSGLILGYLAIALVARGTGRLQPHRPLHVAGFVLFYVWELILANLRVAQDLMRIRMRTRSAIVAVPLEELSDSQLTLLANLITMTPGTLSVDVSRDRRTLYVHAMFMHDADKLRHEIKHGFERRVRKVID
jgi:multicomponent Na+:H+ antiporter subunit E